MIKGTTMKTPWFKLTFVLFILLLLISLNLCLGSVHIPFHEVMNIITGKGSSNIIWENILFKTRVPQTIVAFSTGMSLGVAGLFMQTLFHNPLAGPSVLGISSGSSLGVALVILVAGQAFDFSLYQSSVLGELSIIFSSLTGAFAVLLLILFIAKKIEGNLGVLIMGVMIGYLANSLVSILKYYSVEEHVHRYVIWGLGSFNRLSMERAQLYAILVLIPTFFSFFLSKPLNLISLGNKYARNLGLKIERARFLIIFVSGILTALTTTFCGPIIFIGMAVPHLAKLVSRTSDHLKLILNTSLIGAATTLLCNLIAKLPGFESELPINSVTAFIGAPVVISVIWKKHKKRLME